MSYGKTPFYIFVLFPHVESASSQLCTTKTRTPCTETWVQSRWSAHNTCRATSKCPVGYIYYNTYKYVNIWESAYDLRDAWNTRESRIWCNDVYVRWRLWISRGSFLIFVNDPRKGFDARKKNTLYFFYGWLISILGSLFTMENKMSRKGYFFFLFFYHSWNNEYVNIIPRIIFYSECFFSFFYK